MSRFIIIGAGEAGTRAALALRDSGAGAVLLVGAEPHLPYERPPLSKPAGEGVTIRPIAASLTGIDARLGSAVTAIDRAAAEVVLDDGERIGYDRLLLATGASPRRLPVDPLGRALVLRTRGDAEAIDRQAQPGRRVAIVGAGLIGLELAAGFVRRGLDVTVLEAASRAMGRVLPADMAAALVERHRREGVRVQFDVRIEAIEDGWVRLEDGTRIAADVVVAAIGVVPETALAETAGLACANGILVDAGLRTADPLLFAAGDCAAVDHPDYGRFRFETWRNACDQGALAARAMTGEDVSFAVHPWFWSDQYDLGLQMVGLHDPARSIVRRDLASGGFLLFELDGEGRLRAACGLGPGQAVAKDVRLAEMLIEKAARPPRDLLADPSGNLKSLLRAA
jgi:3-phenylpropionate/trans-cinnamate dioxygenase ferredoxin reductase component